MAKHERNRLWVISGTHWDREWRYSADESLLRLSEIVDSLFDILEHNKGFTCFHLDGGTVVLEDYLAVRPENEGRLRKLIEQGRIATVPWYTLPEMNTVAPESLIRNLLIGKRMAAGFGATTDTGYTATSYGQISQLPQIYAGFGLRSALTYRGTNRHQVPPICLWESPDGTRIHHIRCFDEVTRTNWYFFVHYELVLGKLPRDLRRKYDPRNLPVHMADDVLYQGGFQMLYEDMAFNDKPEAMKAALRHFLKQAQPQQIGPHILALDMEDNASPYDNLPAIIRRYNKLQDDWELVLDSLDNYTAAVIRDVNDQSLPVHKGEMRFGIIEVGFNGLLGTTQSSRTILKLLNNEAERELIAVAEPLCSMSAMLGGPYWQPLLDRAWLLLLKSHCHDSICGAAIDEAHQDMPTRFRAVSALARETSRESAEYLWSRLNTASAFGKDDLTLTFFNTLPTARGGVVPVIVDTPVPDLGSVYVEACSGAGPITEDTGEPEPVTYDYFDLIDDQGRPVGWVELEREKTVMEVETRLDSSATVYDVVRHRLLMEVDVPPMGYRTYALRPRERRYVTDPQPVGDRPLLAAPGGILENESLKVQINPNGTFNLTDKRSGRTIAGMHWFCDNGSVGNAHMNKSPLRDFTVTSLGCHAVITLIRNTKLAATWRIDLTMPVPAEADLDARNRSRHMLDLEISTWLTLRKGTRRLEVRTRFDNRCRDHRLRAMLPSDVRTNIAHVESAFDVVERDIRWKNTGDNHEGHYPFQPMQGFVDLTDGKEGLAVLSKGLREYEVVDDARRTVAITLMRAHRAYMRANRGLMTPDEYDKCQGQHSIGIHDMEYAILPHAGDWQTGDVMTEAQDFNTPWRIIQGVPKPGDQPLTQSLIRIGPEDRVRLSAFYQSADRQGYILRLWNCSDSPVKATIQAARPVAAMRKVSMDEQRIIERIQPKAGKWVVPLRGKEIATLYIKTGK